MIDAGTRTDDESAGVKKLFGVLRGFFRVRGGVFLHRTTDDAWVAVLPLSGAVDLDHPIGAAAWRTALDRVAGELAAASGLPEGATRRFLEASTTDAPIEAAAARVEAFTPQPVNIDGMILFRGDDDAVNFVTESRWPDLRKAERQQPILQCGDAEWRLTRKESATLAGQLIALLEGATPAAAEAPSEAAARAEKADGGVEAQTVSDGSLLIRLGPVGFLVSRDEAARLVEAMNASA